MIVFIAEERDIIKEHKGQAECLDDYFPAARRICKLIHNQLDVSLLQIIKTERIKP
jgi:hypothetical protein